MESLQGNFLIATPQMPDPRFREQVIYICSHNDEGAMGLIVNHPSEFSLLEVFLSANVEVSGTDFPQIYIGGPVEVEAAFFLYSSDYVGKNQLSISDDVSLSRDPQILHDIAGGVGPQSYMFILGYSGWAPGQLEAELTVNGWLTLPAKNEILFHTENSEKWKNAAMQFGIDISLYSDEIGTA
nr:YqgE/AlgH family protein [Desulfobulbaceae bacterium]